MYITQSLHKNLRVLPDAIAVRSQDTVLTYRDYADRVARLAGAFHGFGLVEGDRVAILSLNSPTYLEYAMAVPWAGGVMNPISTRWSVEEVVYALDDSGSKVLIVDDEFLPLVPEIREKSSALETVIHAGNTLTPEGIYSYEELLIHVDPVQDAMRGNDDLAGIFYTGGTTGAPKGVMLSHTNLCSSTASIVCEGITPRDCSYLHVAPMFHLADFAMLLATFFNGGCHVVMPAFEPREVASAIEKFAVTDVLLVPTMIQMLVSFEGIKQADLSSLKQIMYGASPMPSGTLKEALKLMPDVGFIQLYGMTELAPIATINGAENHSVEAQESGRIRSAGRSGILQEIKIVDESGLELPKGEVGEVAVRGPNVMQGYWGKPEVTAITLRKGWMYTGDGGYMDDDGYIYIVDRVKDMIITGGENVYSAEVETVISMHQAVAQCAVIGVPSEKWGESVHTVVVLRDGFTLDVNELRDFCKKSIAGYKCPSSLSFVGTMPLSGAGKILKTELRKPFWNTQEAQVS